MVLWDLWVKINEPITCKNTKKKIFKREAITNKKKNVVLG